MRLRRVESLYFYRSTVPVGGVLDADVTMPKTPHCDVAQTCPSCPIDSCRPGRPYPSSPGIPVYGEIAEQSVGAAELNVAIRTEGVGKSWLATSLTGNRGGPDPLAPAGGRFFHPRSRLSIFGKEDI